jgi:hypothetical protein
METKSTIIDSKHGKKKKFLSRSIVSFPTFENLASTNLSKDFVKKEICRFLKRKKSEDRISSSDCNYMESIFKNVKQGKSMDSILFPSGNKRLLIKREQLINSMNQVRMLYSI